MKEMLNESLQALLYIVLTGVIGIVGAYAKKALAMVEEKAGAETEKIKGEAERRIVKDNLDRIFDLATNVVVKAETGLVADIKAKSEDGKLTKEEGKEILETVVSEIKGQITEDGKELLEKAVKDGDLYLKELVERILAEIQGRV